jgi:hypothetical protein
MPRYFSYIGKLDSPGFFWDEIPDSKFRSGNTPERVVPAGFSLGLGFGPGVVDHWVKERGLEGKQIDWSAWGLLVCRSDMEDIWKWKRDGERWRDEEEWLEFWNQIHGLHDKERYVLVVAETVE